MQLLELSGHTNFRAGTRTGRGGFPFNCIENFSMCSKLYSADIQEAKQNSKTIKTKNKNRIYSNNSCFR